MKKTMMILVAFFMALTVFTANAEDKTDDYFIGKWKVLVEGTPNGDATMFFNFDRVDGKMVGVITGEGHPDAKASRVEVKDNTITTYWTTSGFDVYVSLEKIDENKVKGSMMDMFDASGERVVEEK